LLTDNRNGLWVVTRNGYLWMYNPSLDKFECRNHLVIPNSPSSEPTKYSPGATSTIQEIVARL
jgi:hypothetical protein